MIFAIILLIITICLLLAIFIQNDKVKNVASKNIEKQDLLQENFSVGRGSKVIDIWNYENNERIELQLSGDWNGKNDSKNSEELTKTIEKIFERFFPEDK